MSYLITGVRCSSMSSNPNQIKGDKPLELTSKGFLLFGWVRLAEIWFHSRVNDFMENGHGQIAHVFYWFMSSFSMNGKNNVKFPFTIHTLCSRLKCNRKRTKLVESAKFGSFWWFWDSSSSGQFMACVSWIWQLPFMGPLCLPVLQFMFHDYQMRKCV